MRQSKRLGYVEGFKGVVYEALVELECEHCDAKIHPGDKFTRTMKIGMGSRTLPTCKECSHVGLRRSRLGISRRRYMTSTPAGDGVFTKAFMKGTKVKKVLFMVRREYYDDIVSGEKREEIRNPDKWQWLMGPDPPQVAVFMCGKDRVHRRHITRIYLEDPVKVLGREPSLQGRQDLCYNWGGYPRRDCIVVELGEVYIAE